MTEALTEGPTQQGSAAMAFAAASARSTELAGRRGAIVSCGGNISASTFVRALGPL